MLMDPLMPSSTVIGESRPLPTHLADLINFVLKENALGSLVCAIDPGGEHVGIALGGFPPSTSPNAENPETRQPVVYLTIELTPAEAIYFASQTFRVMRAVVIEYFALFPDKAPALAHSTMPTSRLIGALEYIACVAVEGVYYGGTPIRRLEHFLFEQPPSIKVPSLNNLKARQLKSHARTHGTGGHCLDAELHFYYFMYELIRKAQERSVGEVVGEPSKFDTRPKRVKAKV